MNINKNQNQQGFTVFEIVLIAMVVVLIGTVGVLAYKRTTQNASQSKTTASDTSKQKPITVESSDSAEADKVTVAPVPPPATPVPTPAPVVKPTPPPVTKIEQKTYTYITISLRDVQSSETTMLFAADLPGNYVGTCALTLKNLQTGAKVYKETAVNGSSCSFEVAKTELSSGEWKQYISFYAKDGTVKGEAYKTFTF